MKNMAELNISRNVNWANKNSMDSYIVSVDT